MSKKVTDKVKGFSKKQLLKSKQFTMQEKDILKVIMTNELLTLEDAKEKIKNFLSKEVK